MLTGVKLARKAEKFARILHGIGGPHRLAICYLLSSQELEPRDIVDNLKLPQTVVAFHLKEMSKSGWVEKSKFGRVALYRLNQKRLGEFLDFFSGTPLGYLLSKTDND